MFHYPFELCQHNPINKPLLHAFSWERVDKASGVMIGSCMPVKRPSSGYRKIAEQKIGRRLRSYEVVHHKNLDHNDNRPENLQVMRRGSHFQLHEHIKARRRRMEEIRAQELFECNECLGWPIDFKKLAQTDLSGIACE